MTAPYEIETVTPRLTDAPSGFARAAAAAYVAATLLGVVMRFELAGVGSPIPFDHLLHAHSHTLYFGWAGLGILAAARASLRLTKPLRWACVAVTVTVPFLYFGFLATGYAPFTIGVSTAVMVGWYVVAGGWWRQLANFDPIAALAFRYGLVYLVASTLGIWALAGIQATGGSRLAEDLAIHAFLLGFGWFFVFMVAGAMTVHRHRLGLAFDERAMRWTLHGWAVAAWAVFPLGVMGGAEVPGLGPLARAAGIALVVPGVAWVVVVWRAAQPGPLQLLHRLAGLWFGLTIAATASAGALGSEGLVMAGRQGVVIFLHALFAGFVTPVLVVLVSRRFPIVALRFHHAALAVMLLGLAVVALGGSVLGLRMAAVGAVALWVAGIGWSVPILRRHQGVLVTDQGS
ncbi:MAG: hypothetical protein WD532_11195 [Acidimicrobiia bacterium]